MGGAPGSLANQQTGIHTGLHVTRNMINDQFQKLSVPMYLIGGQMKILQVECGFLLFVKTMFEWNFSNSLIIHQVRTKEITTVKEVLIPGLN